MLSLAMMLIKPVLLSLRDALFKKKGDPGEPWRRLHRQQVADQRLAISGSFVSLAPRSSDPTEFIQQVSTRSARGMVAFRRVQ